MDDVRIYLLAVAVFAIGAATHGLIMINRIPGEKPLPDLRNIDPQQLAMGIKVEMEHTRNWRVARKIALHHLAEIPDYYTRLLAMEREAGVLSGPRAVRHKPLPS